MNDKGAERAGQDFQAMMQSMADTQQKMWKSWFDVAGKTKEPLNPFPWMQGQWGEFKFPSGDAWMAGANPVINDVTQHLRSAQETVQRLLEISTRAWQAMAPKIAAGEDGQAVLNECLDWFRQNVTGDPERTAKATQDSTELWQLYVQQFQKLGQPWIDSFRQAPLHFGKAATGDGPAMMNVSNLCWDAYERTFGRLLDSPGLGHRRELNEKMLKGFMAFVDARRASVDYQMMMTNSFTGAFEQMMEKMVSCSEEGEVYSHRKMLNCWFDAIDQTFSDVSQSEEYIRLQGRLVNTSMAYQIQEREVVDAFLKTSHIPSSSEMDEAYRRIYELRKEVKELKKGLQQNQSGRSVQEKVTSRKRSPSRKAGKTGRTTPAAPLNS